MTTKTNPLLDAADYINENGWCRNSFRDENGQVCLAGAVGAATGAILPLTQRELNRELRTCMKDFDFTEEVAKKEIPYFKWSKSAAKLRAYREALVALAAEIDSTKVESYASQYAADTYTWESDPKERENLAAQALRNRVESIVIERNDGWVLGDNGKKQRPRTTKAQAVALLKRAAKRF